MQKSNKSSDVNHNAMLNTNVFVQKTDGTKRTIEWTEYNQLKKDILWIFDENGRELNCAFVPEYCFTLPYWEYAALDGDQHFDEEQKHFYRQGALIIILCMVAEYVNIPGGSQMVFGKHDRKDILAHPAFFGMSRCSIRLLPLAF